MSLGDILLVVFIATIFSLGVYGGIRLFRWNKKDHERMVAKRKAIREENLKEENVWKRNDGETASDAGADGRR